MNPPFLFIQEPRRVLAFLTLLMLAVAGLGFFARDAASESVVVKYRGTIDLENFACENIARSSFIRRVCYDAANLYMLIQLKQTYYHYCEIDAGTVAALKSAPSMGQYFNVYIKGTGSDGPFDCRTHSIPQY